MDLCITWASRRFYVIPSADIFHVEKKRRVKGEAVRGKGFEALNFPNGVI